MLQKVAIFDPPYLVAGPEAVRLMPQHPQLWSALQSFAESERQAHPRTRYGRSAPLHATSSLSFHCSAITSHPLRSVANDSSPIGPGASVHLRWTTISKGSGYPSQVRPLNSHNREYKGGSPSPSTSSSLFTSSIHAISLLFSSRRLCPHLPDNDWSSIDTTGVRS